MYYVYMDFFICTIYSESMQEWLCEMYIRGRSGSVGVLCGHY